MENENVLHTCMTCTALTKRAGLGNYFIYTCTKFGVVSQRVPPYGIVKASLGKPCPFFQQKPQPGRIKKDRYNNDSGLDIIG